MYYNGKKIMNLLKTVTVANYDDLTNIPIINADLDNTSADTAKQDQLYRHNGKSATNYKIGMLYISNGTQWAEILSSNLYFGNNSSEVCNGVSWNKFNTSTFNSVFGAGWDRKLGHYGCRANSADDESGLIASLGYSGTYYIEFNIWYLGANNAGMIIRISDSSKYTAEANHVFDVVDTVDMSNMFVSLNTTNMLPSGQYDYVQIQSKTTIQGTVYVAPSNGFAMIRGQFSDNAEYFIHDPATGVSSFYQWLNSVSNGHFPMKKGQEIRLHSLTGNILWADVYFAFSKQL